MNSEMAAVGARAIARPTLVRPGRGVVRAGTVLLAIASVVFAACGSVEVDRASTGAASFVAPLVGGGSFEAQAAADVPLVLWFWAPT